MTTTFTQPNQIGACNDCARGIKEGIWANIPDDIDAVFVVSPGNPIKNNRQRMDQITNALELFLTTETGVADKSALIFKGVSEASSEHSWTCDICAEVMTGAPQVFATPEYSNE